MMMQAAWTVEQAEKAVQEFAAGASKAMLFMRHLSAVALWRWPEDSTSPAPLHHVSIRKCSEVLVHSPCDPSLSAIQLSVLMSNALHVDMHTRRHTLQL